MATNTRKTLAYHRNCRLNVNCCVKHPDLHYSNAFHPPLLGAPSDFCKDALAKGIPIPKCTLAKPETLQITSTPHPEEPLPTNRYRRNWEKWCGIWKEHQEKLTSVRKRDTNPPLMACTDADWTKKEDAELFERTLHSFNLSGFNVKTATHPASLNKRAKEIHEAILPRHLRDYSEMKRFRYADVVRDEMGLRVKCPSSKDLPPLKQRTGVSRPTGRHYDWHHPWNRSKYLEQVQSMNPCDIPDTGYLTPLPQNLILKTQATKKRKPAFGSIGKVSRSLPKNIHIPEVTVTRFSNADATTGKMFEDRQPPVLHVVGCRTEIILTYAAPVKTNKKIPSYSEQIPLNQKYFVEELDTFYATTRGKDTRHITLKNEGATAIRYHWLRFPPTKEMTNLLKNPSKLSENISFYTNNMMRHRGNGSDEVHKASNLEFRFRELPGVILTGQKIDFPIIFRTQKAGYYHETLYLVTHPQLQDLQGRTYAVRMTGICVDPEINDVKEEPTNIQTIKDAVTEMIMEQGATDAVTAIIDSAIFKQNELVHNTSLPFGKVTSESVFYAHNKGLTYRYGLAEKTLDSVRKILELLVPKESILMNDTVCELSIQRLYRLLLDPHVSQSIYSNHFKSEHAETLLKNLSEQTNVMVQPRRFTYPSKEERIRVACTATSLGLVQEIVNAMGQVEDLLERPVLKKMIQSLNTLPPTANLPPKSAQEVTIVVVPPEVPEETADPPAKEPESEDEAGAASARSKTPKGSKKTKSDHKLAKKQKGAKQPASPRPEETIVNETDDEKDRKKKKVEVELSQGEAPSTEVEEIPPEAVQQPSFGNDEGRGDESVLGGESHGGGSAPAGTNETEETTEIMDTTNLKTTEGNPESHDGLRVPSAPEGTSNSNSDYLDRNKKAKIAQAKRIVIEDLLGSAIDRIVCIVDAVKAAEDYRPSNFMVNPNLSCCDQPLI